jgi:hypothetical protein
MPHTPLRSFWARTYLEVSLGVDELPPKAIDLVETKL